MKRTFPLILVSALLPLAAIAQGTVNFVSATANHRVLRPDGTPNPTGIITVALYWASNGSTEAQLAQLGATTTVTPGTGFLVAGGTRTTGLGTPQGGNGLFQIRAWGGGYATYEIALIAGTGGFLGIGKTAMFSNPTGASDGTPPSVPANLTGWTTPLIILIPEPSSFALLGLGGGMLVLFRSRWKR